MTDILLERFWEKVQVDNTIKCWNWIGCKIRKGYGQAVKENGIRIPAHRFAYEVNHSKIPKNFQLDHLCRNHTCVNPEHLEVVTLKENLARGIKANSLKTHCPKGHELKEPNLDSCNLKMGRRVCKTCINERNRLYWRMKKKA